MDSPHPPSSTTANLPKYQLKNLLNCLSAEDLDGLAIQPIIKSCKEELEKTCDPGSDTAAAATSTTKHKIFKFLFVVIVRKMHVTTLEDEVFDLILPNLREYFTENIQIINNTINDSQYKNSKFLENLTKTTSVLTNLIQHLGANLAELKIATDMNRFPIKIIDLLKINYELCAKCNKSSNEPHPLIIEQIKDFFQESQKLQTNLINLLASPEINYSIEESQEENSFLSNVLKNMCELVQIVSALDVRSTAELWKFISKLSSTNAEFLRDGDFYQWFEMPIKYLCSEIKETVSEILLNPNISADSIQRIAKINLFYMKILQRFAKDYPNIYFYGHKFIVDTMLQLLNLCDVKADVGEPLKLGFFNILSDIYPSEDFFINLASSLSEETAEKVVEICLEIMRKMISSEHDASLNDIIYSTYLSNDIDTENEPNIIHFIFRAIALLRKPLKQTVHQDLIVHMGALILINLKNQKSHQIVQFSLIKSMMTDNILLCFVALDLWTLLARSVPATFCYEWLKFWSQVAEFFAPSSCQVYSVFVRSLLNNLFSCLPEQEQADFLNEKPILTNMRLWTCIELKALNSKQLNANLPQIEWRTVQLGKQFFMTRSEQLYTEVIDILELLSTIPPTQLQQLKEIRPTLTRLWKLDFVYKGAESHRLFISLILPIIKVTSFFFGQFRLSKQNTILCNLYKLLEAGEAVNISIKLEIINFLKTFTIAADDQHNVVFVSGLLKQCMSDSNKIVKRKAFVAFREILSKFNADSASKIRQSVVGNDLTVKQEMMAFLNKKDSTELSAQEVDGYFVDLFSSQVELHNCCEENRKTMSSFSLQQVNADATLNLSNKEIVRICNRLKTDSDLLLQLYRKNQLDDRQIDMITDVTNVLSEIESN